MRELEPYGDGPFFVEFSRWNGGRLEYRLFKRHHILSDSDLQKELDKCETPIERSWIKTQNEGHPYQLLSGEVNEHPFVVCFETKEFLKFAVDSLNKNT